MGKSKNKLKKNKKNNNLEYLHKNKKIENILLSMNSKIMNYESKIDYNYKIYDKQIKKDALHYSKLE